MHENQQPQTEAFELSAAEREAIEHEKHHYEDPRAASIEALKIVQKQRGWV
ncbi:NADH-quinone oxidoreductase subunit E, partial [Klebsiella pneumoniae]|nr:NADH-quinone oxidoreductase subunit E [Klebsiella pneumoniae]